MVYGSLHFITFDGTTYSFKALGEFVILRLSSATGSNIFTLQGQIDRLLTDTNGIIDVPVVVRMAAFYQGIGKVRIRGRQSVCTKGTVQFREVYNFTSESWLRGGSFRLSEFLRC